MRANTYLLKRVCAFVENFFERLFEHAAARLEKDLYEGALARIVHALRDAREALHQVGGNQLERRRERPSCQVLVVCLFGLFVERESNPQCCVCVCVCGCGCGFGFLEAEL